MEEDRCCPERHDSERQYASVRVAESDGVVQVYDNKGKAMGNLS